ncbi:RluA family pseudouridine synthase [Thalassotalea atypica]|uniref:RluA family pseudouridine synthase n=1 Tax=Thalassotalea atypica TaxID=2054316 RepID=UPI002572D8AB|nr:RNA pseudouridine synthase [Thalassotalea atypica]
MNKFELHLDITDEQLNVITYLKNACSLSISELKQAIDKGALWHTKNNNTQRLRRLKKKLTQGDQLHFYYDKSILERSPPSAILVHDSDNYSIWHKPYGMLSQGSKWSDHCTILRWAEKELTRPAFVVHRLDRAASGLIIIAHSKTAARGFSKLFELHDLQKHYQIIVHGQFQETKSPLEVNQKIEDKTAKSTFIFNDYHHVLDMSLLDVKIATGRKHQIRLHSAGLGYPVVGDRLHGDKTHHYSGQLNLQLCAVKLEFICPIDGTQKCYELPVSLRPQFSKIDAIKD